MMTRREYIYLELSDTNWTKDMIIDVLLSNGVNLSKKLLRKERKHELMRVLMRPLHNGTWTFKHLEWLLTLDDELYYKEKGDYDWSW